MQKDANPIYALAACPNWLRTRDDYDPWETKGRAYFSKRLDDWQSDYSSKVFDSSARAAESKTTLVEKMFSCWIFHWESAGTDQKGEVVAESIIEGKGYLRGGNLGGNPLFDLVFSEALQSNQSSAAARYNSCFNKLLRKKAAMFNDGRLNCPDAETPEWWYDFFSYLAHPRELRNGTLAKPKLASFGGRCGLRNWIVRPFLQFLPDWIKDNLPTAPGVSGGDDEPTTPEPQEPPKPSESLPEKWKALQKRLRGAARRALSELAPEDALNIRYFFVDKTSNNSIARLLGVAPTTASLRRATALKKYRAALRDALKNDPEVNEALKGDLEIGAADIGSVFFDVFQSNDDENNNGDEK